MKKVLIEYIRDKNRKPIGVVVAIGRGEIGFSLCHKDDKWDREKGLEIALNRARTLRDYAVPKTAILPMLEMVLRAERYFK